MFKTAAGYFFLQLSITGLVINLGALTLLRRMRKKGDPQFVYLIAIITILNDTINLVVNCCYFAPTIIADHYILAETVNAPGPMIMTSLVQFSWYNGLFIMLLMVSNRMSYLVLNNTEIFSTLRIVLFFMFSCFLSFSKILIGNFVVPCCVLFLDNQKYGYDVFNPKDQTDWNGFIDSCISLVVFIVTSFCYLLIYVSIRNSKEEENETIDSPQEQKKKDCERSAAVQFAYVSLYYMITYASLRVTPLIFGEDCIESNMITPVVYALENCANSCIFMFVNEEVKDHIYKKIFKNNVIHSQPAADGNVPIENPTPAADNAEWMMYNQSFQ